jgi:pimeloyl-ACP methyl ester carboxylesterase
MTKRPDFSPWIALASVLLAACSNPPYPRGSIEQLYPVGPRPVFGRVAVDGREIGYAEVTHQGRPRIVFIHGSPGDWKAFADYLGDAQLHEYGTLVAVDRPGFGASGRGQVVADLREQARLLAPLLLGEDAPGIVVGHSLGGAIALRLALDYPERVRGVLLIAASVAPQLEAPRWYNRLASWKLVQWLLPSELVDSNRELFGLQAQLAALDADLPALKAPVYVVQGMRDELVDPRTADYLQGALAGARNRIWRMENDGHFVIWKRRAEMVGYLRELIAATVPDVPQLASVPERTGMNAGPNQLGIAKDAGLKSPDIPGAGMSPAEPH